MALNIKDPETERLAAQVAVATQTTKTGAVRDALRERKAHLDAGAEEVHAELVRFMEEEIWPQIPSELRGAAPTKAEREEILGLASDGA